MMIYLHFEGFGFFSNIKGKFSYRVLCHLGFGFYMNLNLFF